MEYIEPHIKKVTKECDKIPQFKALADKAGVESGLLALGICAVLFLFVISGFGSKLIVDVVGILYPGYMSFKAIESPDPEDDKLWLTYWVVFSIYNVADTFIDTIFFWVPFYFVFKLGIIFFLALPNTRGAVYVYDTLIKPFFKRHQRKIDQTLSTVESYANEGINAAREEAKRSGPGVSASSN